MFYHFPFFATQLSFDEIYIDEVFKEKLIRNFSNPKMHHAYILHSNHLDTAIPIAKACSCLLFCQKRISNNSCNECHACKKIKQNIHPDIHFTFPTVSLKSGKAPISDDFIAKWRSFLSSHTYFTPNQWMDEIAEANKQGNITHAECKKISSKLGLKAFEGTYKISIIYQAELMGDGSNRLLKLIEEPPEKTIFFLLVKDINALLPTIISRCQLLKIPLPKNEQLAHILTNYCDVPTESAEKLAWQSKGIISTALKMFSEGQDEIVDIAIKWLRRCYSFDLQSIGKMVDDLNTLGRQKVSQFLTQLIDIFHLSFQHMHQNLHIEHPNFAFIQNFSKILDREKIDKIQKSINQTAYQVKRNAHLKIALFGLFLEINNQLKLKT